MIHSISPMAPYTPNSCIADSVARFADVEADGNGQIWPFLGCLRRFCGVLCVYGSPPMNGCNGGDFCLSLIFGPMACAVLPCIASRVREVRLPLSWLVRYGEVCSSLHAFPYECSVLSLSFHYLFSFLHFSFLFPFLCFPFSFPFKVGSSWHGLTNCADYSETHSPTTIPSALRSSARRYFFGLLRAFPGNLFADSD